MQRVLLGISILVTLLCNITFAYGQKQTERYIPLGQSPGVSGKYTLIGEIRTVDPQAQALTILGPSGTQTAIVTPRTKIWLDRSKLKLTNLTGGFSDLRVGRRAEVKYEDAQKKKFAEWIKVQLTEADSPP